MSNYTIRPYLVSDKIQCIEAFTSNVPLYFTQSEIQDFSNFLDEYVQLDAEEHTAWKTHYFVIEINERIIACGGFGKRTGYDELTLIWGLAHLEYHKQGYGIALLEHRLNEIKRLYPGTPVNIDTTQHSAPFFEKYGFKTLSVINDYYEKGMHRYDMQYSAK